MQTQSWSVLLSLSLVWLISALAGISFLRQALTSRPRPESRGWHKFMQHTRFRLSLAAGIGLLLWVISSLFWVLFNQVPT